MSATFAFARFIYKMWYFGHSLSPDAPINLKAFTPAILGRKQVANFAVESWPRGGTALVTVFLLGIDGADRVAPGRRPAVRGPRRGRRG